MSCGVCRKPKDGCKCKRCGTCRKRSKECTCEPLGARPSRRDPRDPEPRVSSLPPSIRSKAKASRPPTSSGAMVAPGAASATTASRAPTPDRPPTNYSNVAYSGIVDPRFDNTGPPYDPSTASLSAEDQQLTASLRNLSLGRPADQYANLALINHKVQGKHSDQETFGHRNLYRTASDTATYNDYKNFEKYELQPASAALKQARVLAPPNIASVDPLNHVAAAQAAQTAQNAHLYVAVGRMNHMENYPDALSTTRSHGTHLSEAKKGLAAAVDLQQDVDQHKDLAHRKELNHKSTAWAQNPGAGGDYQDRPPSTASLHSSGSSKVSSSRSGPAPPISSGSKIKRQCKYIGGFPRRQCGNMTSEKQCKNHR